MRRILMASIVLFYSGCSEYKIDPNEESSEGDLATGLDTGTQGYPDAVATPSTLSGIIVCNAVTKVITLSNTGDSDLIVSAISIAGSSWTVAHDSVPAVVAPNEQISVDVTTTAGGDATLTFETNDPDTSNLVVPLSSVDDSTPTLSIISPDDHATLKPGTTTLVSCEVSDDADAPKEVTVSWSSDIEGVLSNDIADNQGVASFLWDATNFDAGQHTITATATDTCGNTATDTITFCQNEGYTVETLALSTWNFEGTANWDATNGWVELTATNVNEAGTAFQISETVDSTAVTIEFNFFVSGGSGADGISLTALDTTSMSGFVGNEGGGIGYGGLPGWSIEIDTYYNENQSDPTVEDHLSVHIDGDVTNPIAWSALPDVEDGQWHFASISVYGNWMTIDIDGVTYLDQEVPGLTQFPAYVGFTAATGDLTNYHLIDSLLVQNFVCEDKTKP